MIVRALLHGAIFDGWFGALKDEEIRRIRRLILFGQARGVSWSSYWAVALEVGGLTAGGEWSRVHCSVQMRWEGGECTIPPCRKRGSVEFLVMLVMLCLRTIQVSILQSSHMDDCHCHSSEKECGPAEHAGGRDWVGWGAWVYEGQTSPRLQLAFAYLAKLAPSSAFPLCNFTLLTTLDVS